MPDPMKHSWRIEEIVRTLGLADILYDNLAIFVPLTPDNLLSWSEKLDEAVWTRTNVVSTSYADSNVQARVEDVITQSVTLVNTAQWVYLGGTGSSLGQEVEVAPGVTYNFSFHVEPVEDFALARAAVVDITTGQHLVPPLNYGEMLAPGAFTRIEMTFTPPEGTTRVRVEPMADTSNFLKLSEDDGVDDGLSHWVEYAPVAPARFIHSTETLYVDGVAYPIAITTTAER